MATRNITFFVLVLLSSAIRTFDWSGLTPSAFCRISIPTSECKTEVAVFVNRLNSRQWISPHQYSYFPFCTADNESSPMANLGQVLLGDHIHPSPYKFTFLKNENCRLVCRKLLTATDGQQQEMLKRLMKGILRNYHQNWIIDNIPVTLCYKDTKNEEYCSRSFPIGYCVNDNGLLRAPCNIREGKNDIFYLFNHLDFEITYHSGEGEPWGTAFGEEGGRIISAKVQMKSLSSDQCDRSARPLMVQSITKLVEIPYTYSVKFTKNNDVHWTRRWDHIFKSPFQTRGRWLSIVYSLIIVLFLSGIVAAKLLRILKIDTVRYYQAIDSNNVTEEIECNSVSDDVLCSAENGMLLSVLIGNGVQVALMSTTTLFFAYLDVLSPANPGALMTCVVLSYVLLGIPAGYTSARSYTMFGGRKRMINVIMTAFACPGLVFVVFFIFNLVLSRNGSTATIPFTTFGVLLALWFCVSAPLVSIGAYRGFKHPVSENSVRTNRTSRQVSKKTFFAKPVPSIILGGILPFACIFMEVYWILNSVWIHQYYDCFGYALFVYIILIVTCSEVTIILCYFPLCAEGHNWWWRSFLTSGSTAVYFFLYSVYYFTTKLKISDGTSTFLYFGYTLMMTYILFLFTGAIGFYACCWFIHVVHSATKISGTEKVSNTEVLS